MFNIGRVTGGNRCMAKRSTRPASKDLQLATTVSLTGELATLKETLSSIARLDLRLGLIS